MKIYTVGYEGRPDTEVFDLLSDAAIGYLVDVRWTSRSRKRGFARSHLIESCDAAGVSYRHIRLLGTPPEILHDARTRGAYDWDRYRAFLLEQQSALDELYELADAAPVALLCYEADPHECHRVVVAEQASGVLGHAVEHL